MANIFRFRRPAVPKRRRADDPVHARYLDAWSGGFDGPPPGMTDRRTMPGTVGRRTGAVVIAAPVVGAVGAYLFLRRRRS